MSEARIDDLTTTLNHFYPAGSNDCVKWREDFVSLLAIWPVSPIRLSIQGLFAAGCRTCFGKSLDRLAKTVLEGGLSLKPIWIIGRCSSHNRQTQFPQGSRTVVRGDISVPYHN